MEQQEFVERFPGLTESQIFDLAELGRSVLNIWSLKKLVSELMYISKEILCSESDIAEKTRYCISDLMSIAMCIHDFDNEVKY